MIDRHSETWTTVAGHAEKELQSLRVRLESSGTDQAATENIRGRIQALREILALAAERQEIA